MNGIRSTSGLQNSTSVCSQTEYDKFWEFFLSLDSTKYADVNDKIKRCRVPRRLQQAAIGGIQGINTQDNLLTISLRYLLPNEVNISKKLDKITDVINTLDQSEILHKNVRNQNALVVLIYKIIESHNALISNTDISSNYKTIIDSIARKLDIGPVTLNITSFLRKCITINKYKESLNNARNVYGVLSNGVSSFELNSAIFEFLYTNLPFYNLDLYDRFHHIIMKFSTVQNKEELVVFHGTNNLIHSRNNTFTTYAFLSTSIDPSIALSYGHYIYVIKLPQDYPYLNIGDLANFQILLPIGTKMSVRHQFGPLYFVEVQSNAAEVKGIIDVLLKIPKTEIKVDAPIGNVFLSNEENIKKRAASKRFAPYSEIRPSTARILSANCYCTNEQYIIKKPATKGFDYDLRRVINEQLAARLYKLFGFDTLDYNISLTSGQYCICSPYKSGLRYDFRSLKENEMELFALGILKGFLVDCILANWDVANSRNVGIDSENKVIRTDVGGALAYRARGEFKLSFFNNYQINEHISLLKSKPATLLHESIKLLNETYRFKYNIIDILRSGLNKTVQIDEELILGYYHSLNLTQYDAFIINTIQQVRLRYAYYVNNIDIVCGEIKSILELQKGGNMSYIRFDNRSYKLYCSNEGIKYIKKKGQKLKLNSIRGKYRYIQKGSGRNEPDNIYEFVGASDVFDSWMQSVKEH